MSKPSDERTTPQEFYDALHKIFQFELDAAATKENTKCPLFYTMENSGLNNPWQCSTFCNPPYSRGEISKWCHKANFEYLTNTYSSVLLLPDDVSTDWFWFAHVACNRMWAKHGRLKFNGNENLAKKGTILAIWGYSNWHYKELSETFEGSWLK